MSRKSSYEKESELQALLEGLKALNESLELETVLQTLVEQAQRLFGSDRCGVYLFDERGRLNCLASRGLSQAYLEAVREHMPWPVDAEEKPDPLWIEDAQVDPELASVREAIEREGIRSILFLPLFHMRLLGKLALYHDRTRRWTPEELRLAQGLADQAALAVARAWKQARLRRWNEALRRFQELSARSQRREFDPSALLREILQIAVELVDADGTGLYLYEGRSDELVLQEAYNLPEELRATRLRADEGLAGEVFQQGKALYVNEYAVWPGHSERWVRVGLQAVLAVPVSSSGCQIGVLSVGRFTTRAEGFTEEDISLLQMLADHTASTLEQLRLRGVQREFLGIGARLLTTTELEPLLRDVVRALVEHSPFQTAAVAVFRRPMPPDDPEPPEIQAFYLEGLSEEDEQFLRRLARERKLIPTKQIVEKGHRLGMAYFVTPQEVPELITAGVPIETKARPGMRTRWGEHDTLVYLLEIEGRVFGRITLANPTHGQIPTPEELEPLEMFVQLAAFAVQRARYQERLQALYRISQKLAQFSTLEDLYPQALRMIQTIFPYDCSAVLLVDRQGEELVLVALQGEAACPYRVGDTWKLSEGVTGWVARSGRPALVDDVSRDPRYMRGSESMGSEIAVPIEIEGQLIGVLNLESRGKRAFSLEDLHLLGALADQLAVAISNLRRQAQINEFQRRLQGIYELSESLAQIDSLDALMERAVRVIRENFAYDHITLFLVEGDELVLRGYDSTLPRDEIEFENFRRFPIDRGISGWVARHQEPLLVANVLEDPRYVEGHPAIRSELAVPVAEGGELLGVLNIESVRENAFTEEDRELLSALARQLAVAIRSLRRQESLKEAVEERERINHFLKELNEAQDLEKVLRMVLEHGIRLLAPKADAGSVIVYNESSHLYEFRVAVGRNAEKILKIRYREEELLQLLKSDRPVILTRSLQERSPVTYKIQEQMRESPPGSTLSIPISDAESGRVIAFFNLNNLEEEGVFTEADAEVLWRLVPEITAAVLRVRDRDRLRALALHDPLTGAYNRHYFTEFIQKEEARARRGGYPISLVMIDIDSFYEINDRFGHLEGDHVLREITRIFMENVRAGDVVVRYGGDEFLIVMPQTATEEAERSMERLRGRLKEWDPGLPGFDLSISFGVAGWQPDGEESLDQVLERADEFMYHRRQGQAADRRRRKKSIVFSTKPPKDPSPKD
jgi:diguanylate cyclase (GGDEF)-like protein